MKTAIAIIIIFASFATASFAQQAGDLDSTFGVNGVVSTDIDRANDKMKAVVIQPDGKIVVLGSSGGLYPVYALVRYNADGSLDTGFAANGKLDSQFTTGDNGTSNATASVALQPDGKIVFGGSSVLGNVLARYTKDGEADSSFNSGIRANGTINALGIQPDGKIVAAGSIPDTSGPSGRSFIVKRFNTEGTRDSSFNGSGFVITSFPGIAVVSTLVIQPDGKIIVAGYSSALNFAIARYNTNGSLDSSFNGEGKVTLDLGFSDKAYSAILQPDGKLVVAGESDNDSTFQNNFTLARYNQNGTLDAGFGINGIVVTNFGNNSSSVQSVVLQPDGKIVAMGWSGVFDYADFALIRYEPNGNIDSTFGTNGIVITYLDSIFGPTPAGSSLRAGAIQADGKIVACGFKNLQDTQRDFVIIRYLTGLNVGIVEFSESENNVLIYPNPIGESATLEYTLTQPETITIRLLDMQGKTIKTFLSNTQREAGSHQQAITLPAALPAGSYLIVIESEKGRMGVKVSKV